ncbi:hypothetical protein F443_12945 [Phytophthora nicotianae P1569]|uniref:Uncharacterized protein n=1 Tax=Phytophthora nicotianae P1569 TaxID=1317065 RepID=V9ERF7_PHYNI|nr:hypothetical protein F443_12945 [Phytophthora nicotianae P1569]
MSLHLVDGEDNETLQAALAFIDENGNNLFSNERSSIHLEFYSSNVNWYTVTPYPSRSRHTNISFDNTPGATCAVTSSQTNLQVSKRNHSRDRQRLEILQLRAEAQVLQNRIGDMKRKQQVADAEDATLDVMNPTFDHANGPRFDVWKDLAKKNTADFGKNLMRQTDTFVISTLAKLQQLKR